MDSDGLLQCPYDANHRIRPSRFPYHLVKCRENNPLIAKEMVVCPYNARHRVQKKELDLHMTTCENRVSLDNIAAMVKSRKEPSSWQSPPCTENWDKEDSVETQTTPFILHEFGSTKPYDKREDCRCGEKTSEKPDYRFK